MSAAAPANDTQPTIPEERFWVKYSPNQELPISSLSSIALHLIVGVGMILLFAFVLSGTRDNDMPVETLALGDNPNAGGGGDPNGSSVTNISGQPRGEKLSDEIPLNEPLPTVSLGAQPDIRTALPDLPIRSDADRALPDSTEAKDKLKDAGKASPNTGPPQSAGKGGTGSGGGSGSGTGTGAGEGAGPGTRGSIRHARNKRWVMSFSTIGGQDYLRQLSALGAIVVAEFTDGTRIMYSKLDASPVPAESIDPQIYNRMVWVDDRPGAISELAGAMGIERTPSAMRVYFPTSIEVELLKKELSHKGKKEEEIHSTVFRVFSQGKGYRIVVSEQKYN